MKRALCLLLPLMVSAVEPVDWANPKALHSGTEKPHATLTAFPSVEAARKFGISVMSEREKSPWYRSLNGEWKFQFCKTQMDRIAGFHELDEQAGGVGDLSALLGEQREEIRHFWENAVEQAAEDRRLDFFAHGVPPRKR